MNGSPILEYELNVDKEAECLYRYVKGDFDIFFPHGHDYYEIFITAKGTVTHYINGKTQLLPEGSLVFIRPEDIHGYKYDTPSARLAEYINLTFSRKTASLLFTYLDNGIDREKLLGSPMPPRVLLSATEKESLVSLIGELNLNKWNDKRALKLKMRVILAEVFSKYFSADYSKNEDAPKAPLWLTRLADEMAAPENFTAGIERMVELAGRSREHICRCFKKHFNITPSEFINNLRINYASNLLINTNADIIDVCFSSGFGSLGYFYEVFAKKAGISPKKFRERYSKPFVL